MSKAVVGQAQLLGRVFLPPSHAGERAVEQTSLNARDLLVEIAPFRQGDATTAAHFRGQILHDYFVPLRDAEGALDGEF